jgi:protoporphyrin/coproporphyrin ferrochelatase
MGRYLSEPPHVHGTLFRTGILLVNLGTPAKPTPKALRRFLKEFLSDARVVEIPRLIWWALLHGIVLNTRPKKSAARYARIWTNEGSPLRVHTEAQAAAFKVKLAERIRSPFTVEYAMRYGAPTIASAVARLKEQHCDRILLFPLYPQYAAATTGSSHDALFACLMRYRNIPALRTVRHYHDHPAYIGALSQNVRDYWVKNGRPGMLLMSFHGVPQYTLEKGDPYHCECHKTARLLAVALGLEEKHYIVAFQSLFGRSEWVKPYTSLTLEKLAREGYSRVDVVCPGFSADCLETLEEIALEGKAMFMNSGGREFHYIPCLNERDDWISAMCDIALENLGGWVKRDWDSAAAGEEAALTLARGAALGAKT